MIEERNNSNFKVLITPIQSKSIEEHISKNIKKITSSKISQLYSSCYRFTLESKILYSLFNNEDAFIYSTKLPVMWISQSCMQIFPYIKHCNNDKDLSKIMISIFNRMLKYILLDPFANAFVLKNTLASPFMNDITFKKNKENQFIHGMSSEIWERKFQLSSIIFPFYIMCKYNQITNDFSFINDLFFKALIEIIKVIKNELRDTDEENCNDGPQYFFQRNTHESFDTMHFGRGNPCKNTFLIKSYFRCSEDACLFPYNIPENALVYVTFKMLKEILEKFQKNVKYNSLIFELENIAKNLYEGINKYGIKKDEETGEKFYVYEIDGYGNYYFMDEPRYPSLLSLPFFGFCDYKDEIYLNTRKRILSNKNPYYIVGKYGSGESSAHSFRNYNGTLFTIMRGLTSLNQKEIEECLDLIIKSTNGLNYLHEYFDINNINCYVNLSFAYAYSFFCILIDKCLEEYPELLLNMK
jgi:meiotically up-regulated gene 157 (Mug157) protein